MRFAAEFRGISRNNRGADECVGRIWGKAEIGKSGKRKAAEGGGLISWFGLVVVGFETVETAGEGPLDGGGLAFSERRGVSLSARGGAKCSVERG